MNYEALLKIRFYRDVAIILLVRQNNLAVQSVLQIKRQAELGGYKTPSMLNQYIQMRDKMFPHSEWLFVTDDGNQYLPRKFQQNVQKYLEQARMPIKPCHPKKLTDEQLHAILGLKFDYQRPAIQHSLSCALLGYLALRAEEVAKLITSDINLEKRILYLRDTKNQDDQAVPIPKTLIPLLGAYLSHIKPREPLFVRHSGKQWDRRDVNYALEKYAGFHEISEHVTPRIMRRTVARHWRRMNIPQEIVQALLRHKRMDTTITNYTFETNFDILLSAMNDHDPMR